MLRHRVVWYIDEGNVFGSIFKVEGESSSFFPSSHTVTHLEGPKYGKLLDLKLNSHILRLRIFLLSSISQSLNLLP
jgi:hypothetical protein